MANGKGLNVSDVIQLLEAADGGDGNDGTSASPSVALQLIQLKKDNEDLRAQLASIKNNLQLSSLLPMLMDSKLKIIRETDENGDPVTSGTTNLKDYTLTVSNPDPISALLPMLMGGGLGGESSDNSGTMMAALVMALNK